MERLQIQAVLHVSTVISRRMVSYNIDLLKKNNSPVNFFPSGRILQFFMKNASSKRSCSIFLPLQYVFESQRRHQNIKTEAFICPIKWRWLYPLKDELLQIYPWKTVPHETPRDYTAIIWDPSCMLLFLKCFKFLNCTRNHAERPTRTHSFGLS